MHWKIQALIIIIMRDSRPIVSCDTAAGQYSITQDQKLPAYSTVVYIKFSDVLWRVSAALKRQRNVNFRWSVRLMIKLEIYNRMMLIFEVRNGSCIVAGPQIALTAPSVTVLRYFSFSVIVLHLDEIVTVRRNLLKVTSVVIPFWRFDARIIMELTTSEVSRVDRHDASVSLDDSTHHQGRDRWRQVYRNRVAAY